MKYKEEAINKCTKKFSIEVSAEEITQAYDAYYNRLKPKASVPGFRKGKAPRNLLERYYAAEADEQVVRDLVADNYDKAVSEAGIRPFGYPNVSDLSFDKKTKLSFVATVELRPEFDLKDYKGIKVKKQEVKIEDKEVDATVERLRAAYGTYTAIEDRGAQKGDYLLVDSKCEIDGEVIEDRQDEGIELDEQYLLPDYIKKVEGVKIGEERAFTLTFPKKGVAEKFQGKKANFTLTVKEIKEKVLPEIDEKFLKMIGDYETVDAFRDAIKKDIEKQKQQEEDKRVERALLDELCKKNSFDMPQSLVDDRKEKMFEDAKKNMISRGMPEADFLKDEKKYRKECDEEAARQVKVAFILDKIAVTENVSVTEEDISGKLYEFSRQYRQSVDKVREYYEQNDMMGSLNAEIRNEKAIAAVKKEAVFN